MMATRAAAKAGLDAANIKGAITAWQRSGAFGDLPGER
jgi:hypothetical protein